jgi:uncharacterized coiled-coil protein SlyX
MFLSLFQTASGSWHIQSILIASGWFITGILLFIQLSANRTERINSFEKEKESQAKIIELESKTKPITFLQSTIEEQVKKITEKSKQVESYQQKLSEVEEKTKPRVIPADKLTLIKDELSKHRGDSIVITCLMNDHEAFSFATQLKKLFESAGWTVDGVNQAMYSAPIKGVVIAIKDKSVEPKARFIFQILQFAGFPSHGELNDKLTSVELIIGSKP